MYVDACSKLTRTWAQEDPVGGSVLVSMASSLGPRDHTTLIATQELNGLRPEIDDVYKDVHELIAYCSVACKSRLIDLEYLEIVPEVP